MLDKVQNVAFILDSPTMMLWEISLHLFLYKNEGEFTPVPIMLSFLRISGSNYAYPMLNTSYLTKTLKIKI